MSDWLMKDPWGFLQFMLYRAPAVLLALSLHEFAHGYAALRCGDPTAKLRGRLSLNPLSHLDLWGTLSMFLFGFGWAKPVPIDPRYFRRGRRDHLLVSLAGVTVNFVLFLFSTLLSVAVARFLYHPLVIEHIGLSQLLGFNQDAFIVQLYPQYSKEIGTLLARPWLLHVQRLLFQFSMVNLGLALFNLLPIPPLDGFHVLNDGLLNGRIRLDGRAFQVAQLAFFALMVSTDFIGKWIGQAIYAVQGGVLSIILTVCGVR